MAMEMSSESIHGWERQRAFAEDDAGGIACVRSEVTRVASTKSG